MQKLSWQYNPTFRVLFSLVCCGFFAAISKADNLSVHNVTRHPHIVGRPEVNEGSPITLKIAAPRKNTHYLWDLENNGQFEREGLTARTSFSDNGINAIKVRESKSSPELTSAALRRLTKKINVKNVVPSVTVIGPDTVEAPGTFLASATVTDPSQDDTEAGFTVRWEFGDGETAEGHNLLQVSHSYTSVGTYTLTVSAEDKDGGISEKALATIIVTEASSPTPIVTPGTTPTAQPSQTPTPVPSATPQNTPTKTPSPAPSNTPPPSTPQPTLTVTPAPSNVPLSVVVNPTELNTIISNPNIGLQSGDKVNTGGVDVNGYATKVAYFKYYWKNLEPADGQFDFTTFDANLKKARTAGQKIAFRIVMVDEITSAPAWLQALGVSGYSFKYDALGTIPNALTEWVPNSEDATFQQRHFQFLQELGRRYNGNADIDSIDIGTVGLWGEWHYWGTSPKVPMPTFATMQKIIDAYFQAFPNTKLIAQLDPANALQYAISKGAGFRGDCLGYVDNQMKLLYEPNIAAAHAENAWKTAPILFETCWNIPYWVNHNFDVRYIFDWAISHHMSALNTKNSSIPVSVQPEIDRLLKKIGYRYVLRQLRHATKVSAGQSMVLSMDWENIGNAPSYTANNLAVQLVNSSGVAVATLSSSTDVRSWLPGPFALDQTITIPATLGPGTYTLALGIVDPSTQSPKIQLAIAGRNASGWYPLSTVIVQ